MKVRSLAANGPRRGDRPSRAPKSRGRDDKMRERIISGACGTRRRLPKESELAAELGLPRNLLP